MTLYTIKIIFFKFNNNDNNIYQLVFNKFNVQEDLNKFNNPQEFVLNNHQHY